MTACPPPTRQRTLALIDLGVREAGRIDDVRPMQELGLSAEVHTEAVARHVGDQLGA